MFVDQFALNERIVGTSVLVPNSTTIRILTLGRFQVDGKWQLATHWYLIIAVKRTLETSGTFVLMLFNQCQY